jgi:hypothetical protein
MTDADDVLTEDDAEKIIRGLLKIAGKSGLTRDQIADRFEKVAGRIREIKIGTSLYETFVSEDVLLDVDDDGELRCYSAKNICERDAEDGR